jgi:hypothetical protein
VSAPVDAFSLTRLFIAPGDIATQPSSLTQPWTGGTMLTWDPTSMANTVQVGPILYQNLPTVSPVGLTEGQVLLAKGPSGYIIVGMLASAGNPLLAPIRYRELPSDITAIVTTLADAGTLNFQVNTDTKYGLDGVLFYTTTSSSDIKYAWTGPANMAARWGMHGTTTGTLGTSGNVETAAVTDYGDANPQAVGGSTGAEMECRPMGRFATTDTAGILQLRFACNSGVGPTVLRGGSWLRLSDLGSNTSTTTFIKQYAIIASRSYDDSGNPIGGTDQDNNVYFGEFPDRSFGNERSMIVFDGATIRSDLAGATLLSARLYLYCFKAEETQGSFQGQAEPNSSVPATYNPSTVGFGVNDLWTVPSWNSMDCLYTGGVNSYLTRILGGDNAVGLTPTSFGRAATGFRGFGFSAALRPYIEVTYAA